MISVLIPTRHRPELLRKSIESLLETATNKVRIEVLVRVDDDDKSDLGSYDGPMWVITRTGPRHGYEGLHHYYNELAEMAKGDWLLLWNDDAIMKTKGWDKIIEDQGAGPKVLNLFPKKLNIFPVMSRELYNILGHFAQSNHNDTYLEYVSRGAGIEVEVPGIEIDHIRDTLTDKTREETREANRMSSSKFYQKETQDLIQKDIDKIKAHLHGQVT